MLKFAQPDSLIQPGKTTFKHLTTGIAAAELTQLWNAAVKAESPQVATSGGRIAQATKSNTPLPASLIPSLGYTTSSASQGVYSFPLPIAPTLDFTSGGRRFGAGRDGGARLHAGCDLITPAGTPICAIADGVVRKDPYYFYNGSYALEVTHGSIVVRYGEILAMGVIDKGLVLLPHIVTKATVKKGEVIAYVAKMTGGSAMLHFESYSNSALLSGLTDKSKSGGKYKRRSDLMDPTNLLESARKSMPPKVESLDKNTLEKAIKIGHLAKNQKGY